MRAEQTPMTLSNKMVDAYVRIRESQRTLIREEFSKELLERPWVGARLEALEGRYDEVTRQGILVIRELADEDVWH